MNLMKAVHALVWMTLVTILLISALISNVLGVAGDFIPARSHTNFVSKRPAELLAAPAYREFLNG